MTNRNIFKTLVFFSLLLYAIAGSAQSHVEQVLIANGGIFGNPGNMITIGSYRPSSQKYTLFDSVSGNSVDQVLIDSGYAYMATDSYLVKYNLASLKRTNIVKCGQLRYIAVYKDEIVATLGDTAIHLKIFKKSDLSLVYSEAKIPAFCNGVTISGDSAYIALQGDYPSYNDTGKIVVEDLVNQKLKRIIALDTAAKGISDMFSNSSTVIGVTEYPYANIAKINLNTGEVQNILFPSNSLSPPFAFYYDTLYDEINGEIDGYIPSNNATKQYDVLKEDYDAAALDTINKLFYCTGAGYSSPTMTWIYNYNNKAVDSFNIGISPEGIAIDYEANSGIDAPHFAVNNLLLYPNPAQNQLNISGIDANNSAIKIIDMTGRVLFTTNASLSAAANMPVPVSGLPQGIYFINIQNSAGIISKKFVKN